MKVCVCVRAVFSSKQARLGVIPAGAWCASPAWEAKVAETTVIRPRGIQNIRLLRLLRPRKQVRELPCVLRVLPCWPAATVIHRIASRLLGIRKMGWAGHLIATMSPPLKFELDLI